jgi:hypothetical protein
MKRQRTFAAAAPGSAGAMKNWRYIAPHSLSAAAFISILRRYALSGPLDSSLLKALTFDGCAAGLAYM